MFSYTGIPSHAAIFQQGPSESESSQVDSPGTVYILDVSGEPHHQCSCDPTAWQTHLVGFIGPLLML